MLWLPRRMRTWKVYSGGAARQITNSWPIVIPIQILPAILFEQNAESPVEENQRRFEAVMDRLLQGMDTAESEDLRRQLDRTRSMLGALVDLHWEDSLYERPGTQAAL